MTELEQRKAAQAFADKSKKAKLMSSGWISYTTYWV